VIQVGVTEGDRACLGRPSAQTWSVEGRVRGLGVHQEESGDPLATTTRGPIRQHGLQQPPLHIRQVMSLKHPVDLPQPPSNIRGTRPSKDMDVVALSPLEPGRVRHMRLDPAESGKVEVADVRDFHRVRTLNSTNSTNSLQRGRHIRRKARP